MRGGSEGGFYASMAPGFRRVESDHERRKREAQENKIAAGERAQKAIRRLERAMGTTLVGSEQFAPGRIANALRAVVDDRGLEMLKRQRDTLKRLLEITEKGIEELEAWKEKMSCPSEDS